MRPFWLAALIVLPFLFIDLAFLIANCLKIADGGWLPLLIGIWLMVIMLTWRKGSALLRARTKRDEVPLRAFIHSLEKRPPWRADGTAIYLTGHADTAPSALLHNLKHNKVLHEQNLRSKPQIGLTLRRMTVSKSKLSQRHFILFG